MSGIYSSVLPQLHPTPVESANQLWCPCDSQHASRSIGRSQHYAISSVDHLLSMISIFVQQLQLRTFLALLVLIALSAMVLTMLCYREEEASEPHGHITSLSVLRTHRKLGIAQRLMQAARELSKPCQTRSVSASQTRCDGCVLK